MNLIYFTPIISSFIGYFTNHIAIVMLFRPYNDVKIGKLKFFGKGVIPSNHKKLADSIGKTVSKELLTHDDVLKEIHSSDVQDFAQNFVHNQLDDFFDKDLDSLDKLLPEELNNIWVTISKKLEFELEKKIQETFSKKENIKTLSLFLEKWISNISKEDLFSKTQEDDLKNSFKKQISNYVTDNFNKNNIHKILKNLISKLEDDNRILKNIIPESINQNIKEQFPKISNLISDELITFFEKNDEDIKEKIMQKIMEYLDNMNLGMIASFLPEGFLEKKVEFLPNQILAFAKEYLSSEDGKEKIILTIDKTYQTFLNKGISDVLDEIEFTKSDLFVDGLSTFIVNTIQDDSFNTMISENISQFIDENFDDIITNSISYLKKNIKNISSRIIENFSKFIIENPHFWKDIFHKEFQKIISKPIGKLSKIISKPTQEKIKCFSWEKISESIIRYAPQLIKTVDIKNMVTTKVSSFPLQKMEKLIRDVAKKELKYVTIFGGILGFIIGLLQLLIYQFS